MAELQMVTSTHFLFSLTSQHFSLAGGDVCRQVAKKGIFNQKRADYGVWISTGHLCGNQLLIVYLDRI